MNTLLPRTRARACWLSVLVSVCMAATAALEGAAAEPLPAQAKAFLAANCLGCHDAATASGDVNLDFAEVAWTDAATTALLERVHRVIAKGDMPPESEERPKQAEQAAFVAWLDAELVGKAPQPGTLLRRLSRIEYARTIEQVFGKRFELPPSFPEDTRGHGFDNVAEVLTLSPALLESYAECATMVADELFPPAKPPLPPVNSANSDNRTVAGNSGIGT